MSQATIHVLLADDDEDDRLIFRDALQQVKLSTKVNMVVNGVELMDLLHQQTEKELPHILFLDLNMPLKGGLECLREIRNSKLLKNVTVAIYSTSASEEDIENTFIQGANVYIKKPNDFSLLVKVLSEVITINWQYHTSDLNKENFVLSI